MSAQEFRIDRPPVNAHEQLRLAVADLLLAKKHAVGIDASNNALPPWRQNGWEVFSPFFQTDPGGPWDRYGKKTFLEYTYEGDWRARRKLALAAAMQWARETYAIEFWSRNRRGEYVPTEVNKRYPIPKEER